MISKVVEWAEGEEAIRALLLIGSRVKGGDALSDYDISVFCKSDTPYLSDDAWMESMGKVWVYIPEKMGDNSTRLVIYEGGVNVDFAFYRLDQLEDFAKGEHLVLLDKDGMTEGLPPSDWIPFACEHPSEEEFLELIREFWFEVFQIAKYIKREDLWVVKMRTNYIHDQLLLKMIRWYELAKENPHTHPTGKRMQSWIEKKIWEELSTIFARFDAQSSREALFHLIHLFRKLAILTALRFEYPYPYDTDKAISSFVEKLC